ncbi:MAG: PTS sugar transporter subunit IIA [Verrucomicrobiota bacterium]|nr:PTS sugar transporter subunit IIA [Verrucomicrobiota bacterium]
MTDTAHAPINLDAILLPLLAETKVNAIRQLVDAIGGNPAVRDAEALYEAILVREEEAPTALGMRVAMPHARTRAVTELVIVGGRLEKPMPWGGSQENVRFIFLLGVPPLAIEQYLHAMKTFAHAFKRTDVLKRLDKVKTTGEFEQTLRDAVHSL